MWQLCLSVLSLQEADTCPCMQMKGGGGWWRGGASTLAVERTVWLLLNAYIENAANIQVIDILDQLDHGMWDSIDWKLAHVQMLSCSYASPEPTPVTVKASM